MFLIIITWLCVFVALCLICGLAHLWESVDSVHDILRSLSLSLWPTSLSLMLSWCIRAAANASILQCFLAECHSHVGLYQLVLIFLLMNIYTGVCGRMFAYSAFWSWAGHTWVSRKPPVGSFWAPVCLWPIPWQPPAPPAAAVFAAPQWPLTCGSAGLRVCHAASVSWRSWGMPCGSKALFTLKTIFCIKILKISVSLQVRVKK